MLLRSAESFSRSRNEAGHALLSRQTAHPGECASLLPAPAAVGVAVVALGVEEYAAVAEPSPLELVAFGREKSSLFSDEAAAET